MAITVNQYGTGTPSSQGNNTITHFYDRAGIRAATTKNVYQMLADRKSMPTKYGKNFKISKWLWGLDNKVVDDNGKFVGNPNGLYSGRDATDVTNGLPGLDEGSGPANSFSIKKVTMSTSLSRYGEMIEYTDEVEMFSEDALQIRYREELGDRARRRYEDLVQLDMLAGTFVKYGGIATTRCELGGGDDASSGEYAIDETLVRKSVKDLVKYRAKKHTKMVTGSTKIDTKTVNSAYYSIVGPEIKYDLEGLDKYIPVYRYANATNVAEGEFGLLYDMRFIESESAMTYRHQGHMVGDGSAASAVCYSSVGADCQGNDDDKYHYDAFPVLVVTEGCFATVGLKGHSKVKFNAISPNNKELNNPYGTKGLFSYNFWYAGIILEAEKLLRLEVTCKLV